jgi:hypothetical protein
MAGYRRTDATLPTPNNAGRVRTAWVAGDLWAITGVWPALGRLFGPPRLAEAALDGGVLMVTLALTLGSALLFGFTPALSFWSSTVLSRLKDGARGSSTGTHSVSVRGLLVTCELALAMVPLLGAGLMVKSFWRMYERPTGFDPENTLVMNVSVAGPRHDYVQDLVRRLSRCRACNRPA